MHPISAPSAPGARSHSGRFAFAALILANAMLAFGPWLVRIADVGPVASAFWRLLLAAPFLLLIALPGLRGRAAPSLGLAGLVALGGLFFAADLAAWHVGIGITRLANATLFANMSSFVLMLYGFLILRRLPAPVQALALASAGIGVALLLGSSYELSARQLRGDLFALLGGLFYAVYLVVIDRARRTMAPMPVLAIATAAGAAPLLLVSLLLGEQVLPGDWTPLVALAVGSQLLGQGLLVYAVGHLSPVVVGFGLLTQPAMSAVIGWLAYREGFGLADAAGALLIAAGLVLIRLPERGAGRP